MSLITAAKLAITTMFLNRLSSKAEDRAKYFLTVYLILEGGCSFFKLGEIHYASKEETSKRI